MREPIERIERLAEVLEAVGGIDDSLGAVELIMELEEEFHGGLSEDEARRFGEQLQKWIERKRERRKQR